MAQENARTYGEFLHNRYMKYPDEPIRLTKMFDETGKFLGGEFPFREIYIEEFEKIWEAQKGYYLQILTDENKRKIRDVMFFQHPLKETEEGECLF